MRPNGVWLSQNIEADGIHDESDRILFLKEGSKKKNKLVICNIHVKQEAQLLL